MYQAAARGDRIHEMRRIVKLLELVEETTRDLSKAHVVNPLFWHFWIVSPLIIAIKM